VIGEEFKCCDEPIRGARFFKRAVGDDGILADCTFAKTRAMQARKSARREYMVNMNTYFSFCSLQNVSSCVVDVIQEKESDGEEKHPKQILFKNRERKRCQVSTSSASSKTRGGR
jgi:hypothetical protein